MDIKIIISLVVAAVIILSMVGFIFLKSRDTIVEDISKYPTEYIKNNRVVIKLGEEKVTSEGIKIKFEEILSESRCPTGSECYWNGQAQIRISGTYLGKDFSGTPTIMGMRQFVTPDKSNTLETFDGKWQIVFYKLDPYPKSSRSFLDLFKIKSTATAYFVIIPKK